VPDAGDAADAAPDAHGHRCPVHGAAAHEPGYEHDRDDGHAGDVHAGNHQPDESDDGAGRDDVDDRSDTGGGDDHDGGTTGVGNHIRSDADSAGPDFDTKLHGLAGRAWGSRRRGGRTAAPSSRLRA
jgi:hypothetical protein